MVTYSYLSRILVNKTRKMMNHAKQIHCSEELKYLLLHCHEPLVFKNHLDWQLLNWSLEDWERLIKNEELLFRCGKNSVTKEPQWERSTQIVKSTFKEFIDISNQNNKNWMYFDYKYLKDWFNNVEELYNNINWSSFGFPELKSKDCTIWIGSKGAHTPCHVDTYGWNLVAQIYGRKQWLLFPPEENLKPTRVPYEESSIYSKLNFFSPLLEEFKGIGNCRKIILNPGDVLFVPHKWWHFVENLDTAISINVWLPLPEDNNERFNESLVQLFVGQIINKVDSEARNVILNPNSDEDLKILTFDSSINLIKSCKDIITVSNKRMCLNKQQNVKSTHLAIRSLSEIFDKYPFIHKIPKLSQQEFKSFLQEQRTRFDDTEDTLNHCPSDDTKEIVKLINAFTHPDVVSLIRNKLLEE